MLPDEQKKSQVSIDHIVNNAPENLELKVIAGHKSLKDNFIDSARIQKLGLAFAGYDKYIHLGRIQMIGGSELSYLSQLDVKAKSKAIDNLDVKDIRCVLVTKALELPAKLVDRFESFGIPVLRTSIVSSLAISSLSRFLQNELAQQMTIHAVMLRMYGLGVLIIGRSGIGKSESALDLIRRGHSLISDDSVIVKKIGPFLEGSSPKLTYEHLEVRGLGILNIKDLYGVSAVGQSAKIDLCIELEKWVEVSDLDRLGIKTQEKEILGVNVPKFIIPVSSGRNIATLVETAIRVHLLKIEGHDAARELIEKHNSAMNN